MRILRPEPVTDADRRCVKALETWRTQFNKQYSPLVDLFYGLQHIIVKCKTCGNCSHRWETFTSLKANIKQGAETPTLIDMLKDEYKPETIADYECLKCGPARQEAEQTTYIWRMPHYLTFVVKRFVYGRDKINTPIAALPKQGEEPISFEAFFSEESPEKAGNKYRLHSIVDHHGPAGGGHYTAQCRSLTDPTQWHLYDDNSVHEIKGGPVFGASTYMLWFERK